MKKIVNNYLNSGMEVEAGNDIAIKVIFINIFTIFGVLPLLVFGSINTFVNHDFLVGGIEIFFGLVLVVNSYFLRVLKKKYLTFAVYVMILTVGISLISLLFEGGIEGTGIYWFYTLPVVSIFLLGRKEGSLITSTFIVIILAIIFLDQLNIVSIYYNFVEIRQMLSSMIVYFGLVYFFQGVIQNSRDIAIAKKDEASSLYASLLAEREKSEGSEKEVQEKLKELEDTKRAIINLLEDSKDLEESLKLEKDKMNLIISSMGESLLVVDSDLNLELINKNAESLLEIKAEDVLGKKWSGIVETLKDTTLTPDKERSFSKVIADRKIILTKLEDNHYYKTRSGRIFPVTSVTAPLVNDAGELLGAVKVFRDATEEKNSWQLIEKKVEERTKELKDARDKISEGWLQLQQEKARLTASINNLSLGFVIVDTNHNVVIINPAMEEIVGVKSEDWKFTDLQKVFTNNKLKLDDFCMHCKGKTDDYKVDGVDFNNKIVRIISVPIFLPENNKLIGSAILIEDITEAKILERSRNEFFSIASHELRTPLTAIRGNASLIEQYYTKELEGSDMKAMISDIHESSIRLIQIVNDFLDLSRLEQGRMQFKKENIDINPILSDVIEELKTPALEKKLDLKFVPNKTKSVVLVNSDKEKLRQVFVNIIGNSIKYTDKGSVSVTIENTESALKVLVSDTGRGIPKESQNLLFRKFQQAGDSLYTRDTTKGTGLGLYISRLLMTNMGGSIDLVSSEAGKGSQFSISIPIAK